MDNGNEASGFPCPGCGQADSAVVELVALPQVELRCPECGWTWAVEPSPPAV